MVIRKPVSIRVKPVNISYMPHGQIHIDFNQLKIHTCFMNRCISIKDKKETLAVEENYLSEFMNR